ncbi:Kinectin [Chelonia mydas]|uniref:Kinectin n=1 Tax=Chelonia mydas TaxID=8469 RepID=M7B5J0_CHEMY|nr:Kinectin [Chelonia mydas]
MEFYESTYFIILIPSVVITVIFLFFWLFMKETLYDEVLAKQKRDQKFLPSKVDKKKTEKKKNKRKDAQNGNLHESDSESTPREFKLSDALIADDEHVLPVPLGLTEASSSVRERKKKEKKHKTVQEEHVSKESEGAKPAGKKIEPVPVTKQPTPPSEAAGSKKKPGQKKQKNGIDDQDSKSESFMSPTKKQDPLLFQHEIKQESGSGKKKVSTKKQKIDTVTALVDEPPIHATTYIPLMDNSDLNPSVEKKEVADMAKQDITEAIQKSGAKKLKNETDKENAEVKFKDFLLAMKSMIFTEGEALCVVELLKEKSSGIQDALQKASKGDSAATIHQLQEKDKILAALKEEAAVAKDQCKQLTQELVAEKERSNLLTTKMRERINMLEKEHGAFQSKIHVSFQENQGMKMKFQQLREQMEAEIGHLKQENGILRDAVSTSTNQMESKQSSELNKLRQDCARLVNELTEKNNKLQQEELQKKNADQTIGQLKVQQQEAERRLEEIQAYFRKRIAEHEAAQQDVQNKLVAKDSEIQSLHSKLTDTIVSKQQLEQRMLQLMEAEQKRVTAEDSVQLQVQELIEQKEALKAQLQQFHSQMAGQTSASVLAEELQKVIAEKDKQIKQVEDSLVNEHANLTGKEEELKVVQNMNLSLKAEVQKLQALTNEQMLKDQNKALQLEVQKLQALLSEQANKELLEQMERSITEKDEKIKTVEELLEAGLIQVANREEELKALRAENSSLKKEVQNLQIQQSEQISFESAVEELQKVIREKDGKIKSVEELLEAEVLKVANKEKMVQAFTQEIEALKEEVGNTQLEMEKQVSIASQVKDLQNLLKGKEEQMKTMEALLEEKEKDIAKKGEWLQSQQDTITHLTSKVQELEQQNLEQLEQVSAVSQVQDLESLLKEKEEQVKKMEAVLEERGREITNKGNQLQEAQEENELFKVQIQELKQETCKQASLAVRSEELLQVSNFIYKAKQRVRISNAHESRKFWLPDVEGMPVIQENAKKALARLSMERQQYLETAEMETRELLQKLFPKVSLPSNLSHSEWMHGFEKTAREYLREASGSEEVKAMEQKLKEAEEMHIMLQLECEKYKAVLAETLKKEREHLESELEKAEIERSTYVSEVRELKTQLSDTLAKLKIDQSERQKVAGDLPKAQESLASLEREIGKAAGDANVIENSDGSSEPVQVASLEREIGKAAGDANVIENSDGSSEPELTEKRLNLAVSLCQDVGHLKKLVVSISQMLSKGKEHYQLVGQVEGPPWVPKAVSVALSDLALAARPGTPPEREAESSGERQQSTYGSEDTATPDSVSSGTNRCLILSPVAQTGDHVF